MKPEFPHVVDNTMLNDFRSCPQLCFRKNFEHWKPQGESIHLHAGAAFAKGLERTRLSFFEGEFDFDTSLAHGMKALIEAWGSYEAPEGAAKSLDRMMGALEFYFSQWPIDQGAQPTKMPSGKRAIEFSFAEPLDFLHPVTFEPIIYAGRCDMICDYADGVYLEDDKTATQLGESWARKWDLRSQFTGYAWAARKAGIDPTGVLVRGVSILKTKYGSAEAITNRPAWEIDRWLGQTHRDLKRMQQCWEEGYWDYNLGDSCDSYGGCALVSVCKSPTPGDWLPMYFERRRWDPLERTETPINEDGSVRDEA